MHFDFTSIQSLGLMNRSFLFRTLFIMMQWDLINLSDSYPLNKNIMVMCFYEHRLELYF